MQKRVANLKHKQLQLQLLALTPRMHPLPLENLCHRSSERMKGVRKMQGGYRKIQGATSDWQCPWAIAALSRPTATNVAYCKFANRFCGQRK